AAIDAWSRQRTMVELEEIMEAHGVPCGRVNRAKDMLEHPHIAARNAIVSVRDEILGEVKMQGVFPKLSATPGSVRWTGKAMGADNDYVFGEIAGYDAAKIATLKGAGVI